MTSAARALAAAYNATAKHDCPACGAPMLAYAGVYRCEDCKEAVPTPVDDYATESTRVEEFVPMAALPRLSVVR